MASKLKHRKTTIVTLEVDETIAAHCNPGDIAIVRQSDGWWTCFVGEDGEVENYDEAFESYNQALWTAKAAAEFDAE